MNSRIMQGLIELKEAETLELVGKELAAGSNPAAILEECRMGMVQVGNRFDEGKYFLPELIMAGEIFTEIFDILHPALKNNELSTKGIIVFGTVQGDVHDIGKDIVIVIMRGVGYEVHDLGTDVPPEKFVEKLQETGATVLGLSGLITTAYESMKKTIEAVVKAGLRDQVKIIIGGGIMNEKVRAYTGADAFGNDPTTALELCNKFIEGN